MSRTVAADKQRKSICIVLFFSTPVSGLCELHKCVWYSGFHGLTIPQILQLWPLRLILIHHFLPFSQALFSSSTLHFMPFWQPCLAAACFASCGPLAPTTQPSMTESCLQVKKKNNQKTPPPRPSTSAFPLPVASAQVSAQLTVWVSPLAGMTMAPHLEGHEIAFNASDRKSWKKYARSMDEYLRRESFQRNGHASSATFIPISSCNASWERKPFVG